MARMVRAVFEGVPHHNPVKAGLVDAAGNSDGLARAFNTRK